MIFMKVFNLLYSMICLARLEVMSRTDGQEAIASTSLL